MPFARRRASCLSEVSAKVWRPLTGQVSRRRRREWKCCKHCRAPFVFDKHEEGSGRRGNNAGGGSCDEFQGEDF